IKQRKMRLIATTPCSSLGCSNNLAEGDLAIDVGANYGQCTIVMAATCGARGTVIAFEPNSQARDVLKRNFDLNPSVKRATIESLLARMWPAVRSSCTITAMRLTRR